MEDQVTTCSNQLWKSTPKEPASQLAALGRAEEARKMAGRRRAWDREMQYLQGAGSK